MSDHSYLDPPPNNVLSYSNPVPSPKRKSLAFDILTCTYDYETKELKVVDTSGDEFIFNEAELAELKAALNHFGIGISAGTVNYR